MKAKAVTSRSQKAALRKAERDATRLYYYAEWYSIFALLNGWDKEKTDEWASRWVGHSGKDVFYSDELSYGTFLHELPSYWASRFLIPDDIAESLKGDESKAGFGIPMMRLSWDVCNLVSRGQNNWTKLKRDLNILFMQTRNEIMSKWLESD